MAALRGRRGTPVRSSHVEQPPPEALVPGERVLVELVELPQPVRVSLVVLDPVNLGQ